MKTSLESKPELMTDIVSTGHEFQDLQITKIDLIPIIKIKLGLALNLDSRISWVGHFAVIAVGFTSHLIHPAASY